MNNKTYGLINHMSGDGATNSIKNDAQYVPTTTDVLGFKIFAINRKTKIKNTRFLFINCMFLVPKVSYLLSYFS